MLILSRKQGQKIVINGIITIEVMQFRGQAVRLAFTAPDDVTIDRQEIHERKLQEAGQE